MKSSVVMATYNGEKYILEQLESIFHQSVKIDEMIIVDDCSTDNTVSLIKKYIIDKKLEWQLIINEKNLGYKGNFLKGMKLATGDVVFLCDQDDRWHNDKVEVMLKHMKEGVYSIASSFNFMDDNGKTYSVPLQKGKSNNNLLYMKTNEVMTNINLKLLLDSNFSQGCTMCLKKELVQEYIRNTSGELSHDWELNIRSAIHYGCYYLDIPLIDYRIHDSNTIGLDDIVDNNIINEKTKRVKERIRLTSYQRNNVSFALTLHLDESQKQLCKRYMNYYNVRIYSMKHKQVIRLVAFYIKRGYKSFGTFKTFVGDIISIIK